MSDSATAKRPKHLNLLAIRLPLPGVVSILHRASGLYLIYALPFLVWALAIAAESPAGYEKVGEVFAHPLIKLLLLGVIWSTMHHLCAGIRFLLLELRLGLELQQARMLAGVVMAASIILTLLAGWLLLL